MTFRNWTDSITGNKLNEGKKKDPFGLNESSQPTFTMYSGITGDAWEKIWKDKNFKDKVTNITSDEDFALDYSYNFKTGKYEDKYVKISNIPLDAFVSVRDRDYEDDDDFESIANLGDEEKINAIKYNDLFLVNLFPYKSQIKTTLIDDSLNEKKKPYKHKSGFNPKLGKDPFGLNAYARELAMGLEEQENQFKVYLDMDGVIADFDQRFRDLSGMEPRDFENKYGKKAFWNLIDEENKIKFWVGIPEMPGAKALVDYVKKYNFELLTSPSAKKQSYLGKILWVRNHIGSVFPSKPRINFKKAKEKHLVKPQLTKTDILIDDREDTIERWNAAGGTGIVYKNISQVLNDLGKLGL
jgi:PAS domain-containing protein